MNPDSIQGTPVEAISGLYLQVMENDVRDHPSLQYLRLTSGARYGANEETSGRLLWLFEYFSRFQKIENHKRYYVNCMYWDDLGEDASGKPLPTTCLVIGPFYEKEGELGSVVGELKKLKLWQKTHMVCVGCD